LTGRITQIRPGILKTWGMKPGFRGSAKPRLPGSANPRPAGTMWVAVWVLLSHSQTCRPFTRRSLSPSCTGSETRRWAGSAYQMLNVWVPDSSE
jgi:hypothetical protein